MNIKDFADELAAVTFAGVCRKFTGIPKQLRPGDLPAQFVDMPTALINPSEAVNAFGTFDAAAARYSAALYIAVSLFDEGLPDDQREAMLDMAVRVEEWAIRTVFVTELRTDQQIVVAGIPYRGVIARVQAPDMD